MGQKINPIALRARRLRYRSVGWHVPLTHYRNSNYATKLHTDYLIRQAAHSLSNTLDIIDTQVQLSRTDKVVVTFLVPHPEYLYLNLRNRFHPTITQTFKTNDAKTLKDSLAPLTEWSGSLHKTLGRHKLPLSSRISIRVKLVKAPYHNPNFIATAIKTSMQRRVSIRRAIKLWSQIAMNHKINSMRIRGIRIRISGRLNGAEMASNEQLSLGKVSLHTISAPVNYCCHHFHTPSGILGIKVWIAGY